MTIHDYINLNLLANGEEWLDTTRLPEDSAVMIGNHLKVLQHFLLEYVSDLPKPSTIHLTMAQSYELNAYAARLHPHLPNQYLICLNYGLFANLHACFMALLTHPAILPEIGDVTQELARFDWAESGLFDLTIGAGYKHQSRADNQLPIWIYPQTEERRMYAMLLANLAIEYITCHELAHILCGHIDYFKEQSSILGFHHNRTAIIRSELPGWTISLSPKKLVEYDADYSSGYLLTEHFATNQRSILGHYAGLLERHDLWYAWFFSLLVLFHLFEEIRIRNGETDTVDYPPPILRYVTVRVATLERLGDDSAAVRQHADDMFEKALIDFLEMTKLLDFDFRFVPYLTDSIYDEGGQLADANCKMQDILKPYRFFSDSSAQ